MLTDDLNVPIEIQKFLKNINDFRGMMFVEMIDEIRNQPCTRLFAYKKTKAYGLECKEVGREFLNRNEVSGSLYYCQSAGYQVAWGRKNSKQPWYMVEDDTFGITNNFWYPSVMKSLTYTARQAEALLKKYIPYFVLPTYENIYSVMDYARAYKKYPQVEMLAKSGFPYLYKDKRLYRLKLENQKKFAKWILNNKEYMYSHLPTYEFIMMAIKNNENGYQTYYRCKAINDIKFLKHNSNIDISYDEAVDLSHYLEKQGCDITTYSDYLNASKILGRNIEDRGVLYPRFLMKQHDIVTSLVSANKNKLLNRKIKKVYKQLEKMQIARGDLKIIVPKSQEELVELGNKLHNCVGTMGYGEKMANGECLILAVYQNGKPLECCELSPTKKSFTIEQLRGDHNQDSERHNDAEKLVKTFITSFSRQKLQLVYA